MGMNNFCDLEQAKRLKAAGFPQGETESVIGLSCSNRLSRISFEGQPIDLRRWLAAPSAAEIMEELRKTKEGLTELAHVIVAFIMQAQIYEPFDLLDALVEAYCLWNNKAFEKSKEGT